MRRLARGTKISKTACVALGGGIASGITTFGTSLYLFGECMYRTTAQPEFMDYVGVGLSSGMMGLIGAGAGSAICFGAAYFINRNKN